MPAVAEGLTFAEFQAKYENDELNYEYWRGRAFPRSSATWTHGLLQASIGMLLSDAGYIAGASVELRIDPEAHPKPDVIATSGKIEDPYPTAAVDVVVEILSDDDAMTYVIEKCRAYQEWGFPGIYVVDSESRLIFRWTGKALEITNDLAGIPVNRIWQRLDEALRP